MAGGAGKPLTALAEAFQRLAAETVSPENNEGMDLASFSLACYRVSGLFAYVGEAFKVGELELVAKIDDLLAASNSTPTISLLLDRDVQEGCVKDAGSHSRNLLRVMRGLQVLKELFELALATEDNNLEDLASMAYTMIFRYHHPEALQRAAAYAVSTLPTIEEFWERVNEDEASATLQMKTYVAACTTVTDYITEQFESRGLGIDW